MEFNHTVLQNLYSCITRPSQHVHTCFTNGKLFAHNSLHMSPLIIRLLFQVFLRRIINRRRTRYSAQETLSITIAGRKIKYALSTVDHFWHQRLLFVGEERNNSATVSESLSVKYWSLYVLCSQHKSPYKLDSLAGRFGTA